MGGVGDYTARLRAALEATGQRTSVISRRDVGRWDARALVRLIRRAPRTGIVHVQYQAAAYDLLGDICLLPAACALLRPRVRTVTTFHDVRLPYLFPRAGALRPAAIRLLARSSHAVIAADSRDLRLLREVSSTTCHVPIGPNVAREPPAGYQRAAFRSLLGLAPHDLGVVYFGMLNASKGLELLLAAFADILVCRPRARLLMLGGPAGASDPTDLAAGARVRTTLDGFGAHVIRTGWLPPRELSAYSLAGDVALLPYADGASAAPRLTAGLRRARPADRLHVARGRGGRAIRPRRPA